MKLCCEIKTHGARSHDSIVRHGLVPFVLKALKSGTFHERLSSSEALFSLTLNEDAVSCFALSSSSILFLSIMSSASPFERRTVLQN